jgi:F0F1-type ATP synthase membrane subunit a
VGDMGVPLLSLLLSNIEILTQFFRPITLIARLWVNIWVGHLILGALSTLLILRGRVTALIRLIGFFFFETGIICLQAFVFSYLIGVYWEENLLHSRF